MQKLFSPLFLNPKDIGMQKYTEEEVASKMKEVSFDSDESLKDFAVFVSVVLDESPDASKLGGLDESP